jgi:N-acetylneuraminate lyase
LMRAVSDGDLPLARREQLRSVDAIKTLAGYGYMGAAKAVMGFLGVEVGPPRLPNSQLSPEQKEALRTDLQRLGFFEWIE